MNIHKNFYTLIKNSSTEVNSALHPRSPVTILKPIDPDIILILGIKYI